MYIQFLAVTFVAFSFGAVVGVLSVGLGKVSANAELRDEIYYLRSRLSKYEALS